MDRITALRARRAAGLEEMDALLQAAAADGNRDLSAEEGARYDALRAEDDRLGAQIAREEDMERRRAAQARPRPALPGGPAPSVPAAAVSPEDRGLRFARALRVLAAAQGNVYVAQQIAEAQGESGLFLANQNTSTLAAGGALVPEDVSGEVIELLRPASVVMSLSPMTVPMPNGNLTMNRLNTGSAASYIGEQDNAPATALGFSQVKLSAKKLAALIPISNDLLRTASTAVDRIVRDDLVAALAQRMDLAFIRGAGTEHSPKGLRFQNTAGAFEATHILAANGTVNLANVTNDLERLRLALRGADIPMLRCGWIMSPRTEAYLRTVRDGNGNYAFRDEMAAGRLSGFPYRVTTQIPENLSTNQSELYLADFAQVVVGEHMGIEVAMSTEAAYVDSGSTMRAAFSRDETVMRAIAQHDIGVRHLRAVAVLTGVTWTPG